MVTANLPKDLVQTTSLTDSQLGMIRAALEEYLAIFRNAEGDIVAAIRTFEMNI